MGTAILIAAVVAAIGFLVWEFTRKRELPPVNTDEPLHIAYAVDPHDAAAKWAANRYPGRAELSTVGTTGSMRPLMDGGESIVLVRDFDGLAIGKIVAYTTVGGSSPAIGSRMIHRLALKGAQGWLPRGDSDGMPLEEWNPITPANYLGTCVSVFKKLT